MCGFVVLAALGERSLPATATIECMRDALEHRGPDDATLETVDDWIALAHRRLAIIDVHGARQPLWSEDERTCCIFNGEIYNFRELRERLEALGHRFATSGDGEVIVHGYEQWGDDVFAKLEGMFSIALVDGRSRRLLLARDRFGIKPLFYTWNQDRLAAASEIKALLAEGTGARTASRSALALGAMRMHIPWPLTAFDGILRLPPGVVLEVRRGWSEPRLVRFAPGFEEAPAGGTRPGPEETLEVLRTAIARQMVADVPVGAFLSGGIDSTLIVALMREVSSADLHTFSIRTVDHDESDEAAQSAREIGTIHHTIQLEDISFEDLCELPGLYDEPFAETSALGVRALSRFAREHVKVALSGDGGDEVFGGYGSYRWIRGAHALRVPGRALLGRVAHPLLVGRPWPSSMRRAIRGALLWSAPPETAQRDVTTLAWAASREARLQSEQLSADIAARCIGPDHDLSPTRRAMLADRLERLPNAMLAKVDIASMSASLEVRVPLLDDAVVRFADRLALDHLLGFRWGKVLLRRSLERLPAGRVAWSKKRGFSLPLDRWMKSPQINAKLSTLFGDSAARLRELTGEDVIATWRAFLDGGSRFSAGTAAMQLLWFANVALWADRFAVRSSAPGSSALLA